MIDCISDKLITQQWVIHCYWECLWS